MAPKKAEPPITLSELSHSREKCRRVEKEIWKALSASKLDEHSPKGAIIGTLRNLAAPSWCEPEAWERMKTSFREWADAFGSLEVMDALSRLGEDAIPGWLASYRRRQGARR